MLAATTSSEQPAAANDEVAVDAALSDWSPATPKSANASSSILRSSPSISAETPIDSLLTIIRPADEIRSFDDAFTTGHESSNDSSRAVDHLFASLDDSDLVAEVSLFALV
jgi:hypothetical protein